ncbi:MAG: F420-dependent methylenetetrahydromethanopterin dehydrogenase [Candidatus Bathyarchaeia archaeon]|nr:F420-dependent methylenetetrahydromethanopterin dehydrogenase [Candidatus Bathyarchaeota archaeon]
MPVKIGFVKLGNIGSAPLIEFLLDERAEREDLTVRVVGSGAKLTIEEAIEVTEKLLEFKPDLAIVVSPNASLPGPEKAREILSKAGIPVLVVSDAPAKKAIKKLEEEGFGYLIVEGDPMIGARREFLDPIEMALFNAEVIKVLAGSGAFNILFNEVDKIIEALKKGEKPQLPRKIIDSEAAVEAAEFQNPYAKAKAQAAYEAAKKVAEMNVQACFIIKDWQKYTALAAASHELIREAAKLIDEAREIEKSSDSVIRHPHYDDGKILSKRRLIEKPR